MKYIILGAGAAGLAAIEAIRKRDPKGQIILCSAEEGPPYSLCALPGLVAQEIEEEVLYTTAKGQLSEMNVDFRPGWQAQGLEAGVDDSGKGPKNGDRKSEGKSKDIGLEQVDGIVRFTNGEALHYDRLLIATGSVPLLPPLPGLNRPGIFTHLDLTGCKALLAALPMASRVAVIGGGFLGVEMAQALLGWSLNQAQAGLAEPGSGSPGLEVVLVEMEDRLLASMLDPERSRLAREELERLGVEVKVNARVSEFTGQGESGPVQGLNLAEGAPIDCDLAVMAVGVRPNLGWLEGAGIRVGDTSGLVVDETLRTNLPGVYAAGDIVESWDSMTGERGLKPTWTNAAKQGRVAGLKMVCLDIGEPASHGASEGEIETGDRPDPYPGWDDYNVVHIGQVPFISCGQVNHHAGTVSEIKAPRQFIGGRGLPCHTSLYLDGERFIGLCSMELPPNIGHLNTLICQGERLPDPDAPTRVFLESSLLARREVRSMGALKREAANQAQANGASGPPGPPEPSGPKRVEGNV